MVINARTITLYLPRETFPLRSRPTFMANNIGQDVANVRGYLAHIKSRECTGNRQSNALLPSSAVTGRAQPQPAAETNLPDGSEMPLNSVCVEAPRSSGGATPLTTPPANVSRAVMGHAPSTAITTETTQGVISPVAIVTPTLTPTVQAEVPRGSGMGLARTERAATRARGSRGSRGSRGTARGPSRANIPPTQNTLSTPSSSCRPTGARPNESGRRSEAQGSGGGRRGQRSQAGDRPSQDAATPLQGRPRQQPDEPRWHGT